MREAVTENRSLPWQFCSVRSHSQQTTKVVVEKGNNAILNAGCICMSISLTYSCTGIGACKFTRKLQLTRIQVIFKRYIAYTVTCNMGLLLRHCILWEFLSSPMFLWLPPKHLVVVPLIWSIVTNFAFLCSVAMTFKQLLHSARERVARCPPQTFFFFKHSPIFPYI